MKQFLLAGLMSLALLGCATSESNLRRRAAYDFECPAEQLQVTRLSGSNRGVEGCGHRGTYVFAQGTGWVLNAEAR